MLPGIKERKDLSASKKFESLNSTTSGAKWKFVCCRGRVRRKPSSPGAARRGAGAGGELGHAACADLGRNFPCFAFSGSTAKVALGF